MRRVPALLALSVLLVSCSFASKDEGPVKEKGVFPDIILENAEYLLGQSGENPIAITGGKITFYSKDNRAEMESFSFVQKDDDGNIILEGSADSGTVNTKSKKMELKGNVYLAKTDEQMEIRSDSLSFDSENEEASAEGKVVVKSDKGSFSGYDFKGDLVNMVYSFSKLDEGNIEL